VSALIDGDPRLLGPYEVTGRLGEGGQGMVYLGRGPAGAVAIKLLHARLISDDAARARFVREVEVTKRVARFCTAQVLDAGTAGDRPYIVSEYVPGPSLHHQLRREGPRRGAALDRLAINTATALAAIHRAGVVHRDFKPGNVLMGPDGPVVIDFGISRALDGSTTVSQVVGTPAFMAPEQLAEGPIGPHTDMFAWAITMVYAATGQPAFGHHSIPKVINRILHEEPELGRLEGRLRTLVAACLTKDPAGRPTARSVMDDLLGQNADPGVPGPSAQAANGMAHLEPRTMRLPAAGPGGAFSPPGAPGSPVSSGRSGGSPSKGRLVLVIGVVAIVLVAGVGVLAAVARNHHKDRRTAAPPQPSPSASVRRPAGHHTPSPSRAPARRTAGAKAAKANPYTPQRLCGSGYRVIGMHGLGGAAAYLLYNSRSGVNCVVTMVPRSTGKTVLGASLVVQGGGRESRSGAFSFYAGPVRLPARGKCVMWGGTSKTATWTSGWSHCGR
jgi:predicted Ser/Thr protein kinase